MATMRTLTVALDWTPNTNHTGLYVAKAKGWFAEAGLDVLLKSPLDFEGSYSGELNTDAEKDFPTPCGKVAAGAADFAMNSPEGCIGWNTPPPGSARPKLRAVAAMLQAQTSAIVTLKSSGLDRPAKLDGKVYASYAARYEGRIVQKLLQVSFVARRCLVVRVFAAPEFGQTIVRPWD
jgi:ABC-type nitrate/sulfonate/bicarbonate transport system substrate-binding protein